MSIDNNGAISTYMGACKNYKPNKKLPALEVKDQALGELYPCKKYLFDKKHNDGPLAVHAPDSDETVIKEQHCFVCLNYSRKS